MKENLFTIEDSLKLARSIAKKAGIRISNTSGSSLPRVSGNTIYMGEPSVYSHVEYMETLHKCIGQVCPDNEFFDAVSRDGREDTLKEIVRAMHTDKYMLGQYSGRDRQLSANYRRNFSTLQDNLEAISQTDPTAAALLAVGNDLRNSWQQFNKLEIPAALQPHVNKLSAIKAEWLSLETADDLEKLLQHIKDIENDKAEDGGAEGDDSPDTSGEPSDEAGESEDGAEDTDSGASGGSPEGGEEGGSEESGDSEEYSDDQEPEGECTGSDRSSEREESDAEGESGEADETGDGSEGDGETEGDSGSSDSGDGGEPGEVSDEQSSPSSSGSTSEAGDGETGSSEQLPTGEDKESSGPTDDLSDGSHSTATAASELADGTAREQDAEGSPELVSYADAASELKRLGIIPDLKEHSETKFAYTPVTNVYVQDNRKPCSIDKGLENNILHMLKDFRLTNQVKKYLMVMSQDKWQTGLRQGKLNGSRICKMYCHSGGGQPRMYKRKEATKMSTDIAITLLIDGSGSMYSGDYKYITAAACAIGMSEVLQGIGVPHEILIFTTDDGPRLVHTIVKDAAEPFVSRDRLAERLSRSNIRFNENGDGEAIGWAMSRLMPLKEREKLLIVLSDGEPSVWGTKGSPEQYLRDIVHEIDKAPNIAAFGIGIKSRAVSKYYRDYKVVDNLGDLEQAFMSLLKEKLLK